MATGMLRTMRPARRPTIEQLLSDQQTELDQLLRDVSCGIRSQAHFDQLEARASAIGDGVRGAFRTGARG